MAYSINHILAGQNAINIFVSEYNKIHEYKISVADVLASAKKYDDQIFLGILGTEIEVALENDQELVFDSMSALARLSVGGLPSSETFLRFIISNKISDIEIIFREVEKVVPQVKYGIYILLGIIVLVFIVILTVNVKKIV